MADTIPDSLLPPGTVDALAASHVAPALLRARDAAKLCGISLASWWRWDSGGKMPRGVKIGGARLWSRAELLAWIAGKCPDRLAWEAMEALRLKSVR